MIGNVALKFRVMVACLLMAVMCAGAAQAEIITPSQYVMIMDHETGDVLYEKNADLPMKPASMAKMMTIYLIFKQIKDASLRLDDKFIVSEKAYRKGGSRTFLEIGSQVSVSDLLRGIIVQSGNDAAIVVAEGLAGTEEAFAEEMTLTATKLGMMNTAFGNATGWPDEITTTTARDLAILARAIITEFPELYKIFNEKSFTYNDIKQGNRNPLLYALDHADGLKTGHTEESGYGLTASAERDGQRIILVLNGLGSNKERKQESIRLMDLSFRTFRKFTIVEQFEVLANAPVNMGEQTTVPVTAEKAINRVMPRKDFVGITRRIELDPDISAPVAKGQQLGSIYLTIGDSIERFPLVAANAVEELPFYAKIGAFFKVLIFGHEAPVVGSE